VSFIRARRQQQLLREVDRIDGDAARLLTAIHRQTLHALFASRELHDEWRRAEPRIASWNLLAGAYGVNPGDRRALYYLVRTLKPSSILEVGTGIGASTVHMALALRRNESENPTRRYRLTTLDIRDVNHTGAQPWGAAGSACSPRELIRLAGAEHAVAFVTEDSCSYLARTDERPDFIFVDGDHSAATAYREIGLALRIVHKDGVIVLHDYFVGGRPLWRGSPAIPGPWLALQRLRREGYRLHALPIGELPWATKRNSRRTSLTLLVGCYDDSDHHDDL
jgi:predicted O-methyltransferase YrrM